MRIAPRSPRVAHRRGLGNVGLESSYQEATPMDILTNDARALAGSTAEMDRLGHEIAKLSAHLDAAVARLLDLIREFDAREGWNNGFRSCAHWLSWRVGLDMGAAREKVRVARALGTLPRLAQALAPAASSRTPRSGR